MELSIKMVMDADEVEDACAQWAVQRMPIVPGYRIEVDFGGYSYDRKATVTMVKIEPPPSTGPDPEEGGA